MDMTTTSGMSGVQCCPRTNWRDGTLCNFHPGYFRDCFNTTKIASVIVVIHIAIQSSYVHRHLMGWFANNDFSIPALQHILFHPNVLFPSFGKLVYAYALEFCLEAVFLPHPRRRLAIGTLMND